MESPWWREQCSMSLRAGLAIMALPLAGCSTAEVSAVTVTSRPAVRPILGSGVCDVDQPCVLTGTVTLERRSGSNSWASLLQNGACAPLLLPESTYAAPQRWNNKRVTVTGTALARGPAASDILSLQYRDRWLSPSICSESLLALYVDKIVLAK